MACTIILSWKEVHAFPCRPNEWVLLCVVARKDGKIATGFSWFAHEFWLWSWHRDKHDPKTSYFLSAERSSVVAHAGNVSAPTTQQSPNMLFCHFVSKCQLAPTSTDGISSINPSRKKPTLNRRKRTPISLFCAFHFRSAEHFVFLVLALSAQALNAQSAHRVYFVWWKLRSERRTMV